MVTDSGLILLTLAAILGLLAKTRKSPTLALLSLTGFCAKGATSLALFVHILFLSFQKTASSSSNNMSVELLVLPLCVLGAYLVVKLTPTKPTAKTTAIILGVALAYAIPAAIAAAKLGPQESPTVSIADLSDGGTWLNPVWAAEGNKEQTPSWWALKTAISLPLIWAIFSMKDQKQNLAIVSTLAFVAIAILAQITAFPDGLALLSLAIASFAFGFFAMRMEKKHMRTDGLSDKIEE